MLSMCYEAWGVAPPAFLQPAAELPACLKVGGAVEVRANVHVWSPPLCSCIWGAYVLAQSVYVAKHSCAQATWQ